MLEGLLRSFNDMYRLPYVALRYFNVYGPRMDIHGRYTEVLIRWMDRIAAGQPPLILGDGKTTMDFIYIEDVARSNILALESDVSDEVFNVASGVETSLNDLAAALLRVMGSQAQARIRPRAQGEPGVAPPRLHEEGRRDAGLPLHGQPRRRTRAPGRLVARQQGQDGRLMIPIIKPLMDEREAEAARRVILSGWITQGPEVAAFEKEFAALHRALRTRGRVELHHGAAPGAARRSASGPATK